MKETADSQCMDLPVASMAALLWLEAKQKVRNKNYVSLFPEMTYDMAVSIRGMGIDKLKEFLEQEKV